MKRRILSLFLCLAIAFSLWGDLPTPMANAAENGTSTTLQSGTYAKGEVIVSLVSPTETSLTDEGTTSFNKDIKVEDAYDFGEAAFLSQDPTTQEFLGDKDYYVSHVTSDKYNTEQLIELLKDKAYVKNVEPNYYQKLAGMPNDTYIANPITMSSPHNPTGIPYTPDWHIKAINAPQGWALPTVSSSVVAIVDSGVDYEHDDLKNKIWKNPFTRAGLPGLYGYNYGDNNSDPIDYLGHGTHCAGIIAAEYNNGKGVAGISINSKIMCLKATQFNSDRLSTDSIVNSFYYIYKAQCKGVKVSAINCSWGQSPKTTSMEDIMNKIGAKGSLFIFAAGNIEDYEGNGLNVDNDQAVRKYVPYSLNCDYKIVVGSCTNAGTLSGFSYYGKKYVNIFAPGSNIASCINYDPFSGVKYAWRSGTSMAAPMVTGAVARLAETYPHDTVYQRKARLLQCVRRVSSLSEKCTTGGILDLSKIRSYTPPANISSVKITNSSRSLYTRKSMQITTRLGRPDAVNRALSYSVSNKKYAKISSTGRLTVNASGVGHSITIKAASKANRALYSTIKIKILRKKATGVSFAKSSIKVSAGKSCRVSASVRPSYATRQSVTYTTSNKRYATVGKSSGVVRTKKSAKGKNVYITAITRDGSHKKARCKIKIR